jgi:hypothetical protein
VFGFPISPIKGWFEVADCSSFWTSLAMLIISLCRKSQVTVCLLFRPGLFPISNTVCTFLSARLVADNAGSLALGNNTYRASDGTSLDYGDNRKLEK